METCVAFVPNAFEPITPGGFGAPSVPPKAFPRTNIIESNSKFVVRCKMKLNS